MGFLCDKDIELLRGWRWQANITDDCGGALTGQGWIEMRQLAQSYQSDLPRLLGNIYTSARFQFRHTDIERTNTSLKAFVEGLFGDNAYDRIWSPELQDDGTLLKSYDQCPEWLSNAKRNKRDNASELNKFENGPEYRQMMDEVSIRLGFQQTVSKRQVKLVYDMCRFEQAWTVDRPSAWCAVSLSREKADVLAG